MQMKKVIKLIGRAITQLLLLAGVYILFLGVHQVDHYTRKGNDESMTKYITCLMFVAFLITFITRPSYFIIMFFRISKLKENQFVKFAAIFLFILPHIMHFIELSRRSLHELHCENEELQAQNRRNQEKVRGVFDRIENNTDSYVDNANANAMEYKRRWDKKIQKFREIKEKLKIDLFDIKGLENICLKIQKKIGNEGCKSSGKGLDKGWDELRGSTKFFVGGIKGPLKNAIREACKEMVDGKSEDGSCQLGGNINEKIKQSLMKEGKQDDPSEDKFSSSYEREFVFDTDMTVNLEVQNLYETVLDYIEEGINILKELKDILLVLVMPFILLITAMIIRNYKYNVTYLNHIITKEARTINRAEKRKILPMRKKDHKHYDQNFIQSNTEVLKKNCPIIILMLVPGIMNLLMQFFQSKSKGSVFVSDDKFESEEFQACYQTRKVNELDFSWIMYISILITFIILTIIDFLFGSNVEALLLRYFYPEIQDRRARWLLDSMEYRRKSRVRHRKARRGLFPWLESIMPYPLVECSRCKKHIYGKVYYCEQNICAATTCFMCGLAACRSCKTIKNIPDYVIEM